MTKNDGGPLSPAQEARMTDKIDVLDFIDDLLGVERGATAKNGREAA